MQNEIIDTKVNDLIKFLDNRIADLESKYEEIDELWNKACELVSAYENDEIPFNQEEYDKACEDTGKYSEQSSLVLDEINDLQADLDNLKDLYYHLDEYDIT